MMMVDRRPLPVRTSLRVPADSAELAAVRGHVGDFVRELDGGDDAAEEFELVVSELVTNVIQHTDAAELTVSVERDRDGWVLDVTDADDLVLDGPRRLPAPSSPTGRGLFVVEALMDTVTVVDTPNGRSIRCTRAAA
jgi:anti-sigma regulatory factor (Ser/Thr protein kinase)